MLQSGKPLKGGARARPEDGRRGRGLRELPSPKRAGHERGGGSRFRRSPPSTCFHPGERPDAGGRHGRPAVSPVCGHERYTDETLARAIRQGIDADGRPSELSDAPASRLGDADMAALIAYLKSLSSGAAWRAFGDGVPGVRDHLHPGRRIRPPARGTIDVLSHFFSNKNDFRAAA